MTSRIIEISDSPAKLRLDIGRVCIERPDHPTVTIPVEEVGVIVLAHPQISVTHPVLAALGAAGAAVIVSDSQRLPAAMMLPLVAHSTQAERMARQASVSLPRRKRIWKEIVEAKVRAQARLLEELRGTDGGLEELAAHVRSGDTTNIESQASVRYWRLIFGRSDFRRDRDAKDENSFLNYGYAILRAMVARALCSSGLHPSLGIHHHNRYDAFRLADDLMEPYRPTVDRSVVRVVDVFGPNGFGPRSKAQIMRDLAGRYQVDGEWRLMTDIVQRAASNLAAVYEGDQQRLLLGVP